MWPPSSPVVTVAPTSTIEDAEDVYDNDENAYHNDDMSWLSPASRSSGLRARDDLAAPEQVPADERVRVRARYVCAPQ
jgi:hypothetical protein